MFAIGGAVALLAAVVAGVLFRGAPEPGAAPPAAATGGRARLTPAASGN